MEEFQLWSVLNSGLISNAIYQAGIFFILWVAFRAANQLTNEDSILKKILLSLFSAGIIFNGLTLSAILSLVLQNTAYGLSEIGAVSVGATSFISNWGVEGVPEMSLISNPIMAGWWLVVAIMLFGRIWQKK
mgnify:FL=1